MRISGSTPMRNIMSFDIINRYIRFADKEVEKRRSEWKTNEKWAYFIGSDRGRLKLTTKPEPYTLTRTLNWISRQVAPTWKVLQQIDSTNGTTYLKGCDIDTVVQAYNYGGGFIDYVAKHGKKYTFELAVSFAKDKSGGVKVTYKNEISIKENGGWRYKYGNMFYVRLVNQYLAVPSFSDATAQAIFKEALKYQGWKYVFGGSNPNTSFDCSGLTSWCYGKAGISLPRTAQAQYDATQHIPLSQAKAGDLVFFHSTYNSGTYVTHVGIYAGNNRMYHAGDPIGYADLTSPYWQKHLIGAGRVKSK